MQTPQILKLPIGIQTFAKIIQGGYCYVDKTRLIIDLIQKGSYYFLSRPRRFGKSLLVDTIKELFSGNKDLFKGLYAFDHWNWSLRHPVIMINLGQGVIANRVDLDQRLTELMSWLASKQGIELKNKSISGRFFELIEKTAEIHQKRVVILVDEYDKPILDNINTPDIAIEIREGLKNFYSVIKDADANVEFALITGVSKFSKVSLFSGLNNLKDITLDERYATLCGYTARDLETVFAGYIKGLDLTKAKIWYNGYNFLGENVYNPFDMLLLLGTRVFRNYWFETATPTFLMKLLENKRYFIPVLEEVVVSESIIGSFDVDRIEVEAILFQTGYLTIKSRNERPGSAQYRLGFPNLEVKQSLIDYILYYFTDSTATKETNKTALYSALKAGNLEQLKSTMHVIFSSIPYDWYRRNQLASYEGYYASIVYCYFASLGLDVRPEEPTNHGRIDLVIRFEGKIFVIEFKVNELTETDNALLQIKKKGYAEKFKGQKGGMIGVHFSSTERNVTSFEYETF